MSTFFSNYTSVYIPDEHFNKPYNVDFVRYGGDYFYYDKEIKDDCTICLYSYTHPETKYVLHIDKALTNTNNCSKVVISNIVSFKDTIYFVSAKKLLKFVYDEQSDLFQFNEFLDLEYYFKKGIQYYAKSLYLQYPFLIGSKAEYSPRFSKNNYYYFKINLSDFKDNEFFNFEYPINFSWTLFQPKTIIDFSANSFLKSELTSYKIEVFDLENNLKATIKRDIESWVADTSDFISDGYNNFNEFIAKKHENIGNISLIHKVNFINPELIMVCYSRNDENKKASENLNVFYDFWGYENSEWSLTHSDIHKSDIVKNKGRFIYQQYKVVDGSVFHIDIDETDGNYYIYRIHYAK